MMRRLAGYGLASMLAFSLGVTSAGRIAADYDPNKCDWIVRNNDPDFTVPGRGEHRVTLDMSHCGGHVQNFQITLMSYPQRRTPEASVAAYDQQGRRVGRTDSAPNVVYIGNVPDGAIYTIVVTSGKNGPEKCILAYSGAI